MPKPLLETSRILEATPGAPANADRLVQLISPGWGSSGYYSTDVLEAAAGANVIPAGTHMYADHPTETELRERPVRSIRDLMGVVTEDAHLATDTEIAAGADPGALVGPVRVAAPYRHLLEDLGDVIGVSIRGAGELNPGQAEGRSGTIVESLEVVSSVDFVTRAGRGGHVLDLMESARTNQRAIDRGIAEATANDTRELLQNALRDAHVNDDADTYGYAWVRDFDDTTVWFELEGNGQAISLEPGLYAQAYTLSGGTSSGAALTGDATEVRVVTTYVPVTRPDSTNPTQESREDTMPQIEESELARLREADGRVRELEERATTAETERDQLREDNHRRGRADRARAIVAERATEAQVTFDDLQVRGLVAELPLTEAGALDETAFTTTVDEQAAALKARLGAGSVLGHGGTVTESGSSITWDDIDEAAGLEKGA